MHYLGIDYGQSQVGLALATGPLAQPLLTCATNQAIQIIKQEVAKHHIDQIIIGDCPAEFLTGLSVLGPSVIQTDETLSSHDARQALLHTSQTRRRTLEHQVAAAVILQTFLDSEEQR